MNQMKLNAVKNLMQSLEFDREDKIALMQFLQQELNELPPASVEASQEYGSAMAFPLLFADGATGYRYRYNNQVVGIVLPESRGRFVLYIGADICPDNTSLSSAQRYADRIPAVCGKKWRVLCEEDCFAIQRSFRAINRQLRDMGRRTIVESNTIGVLTSDGSMKGARGWQVWFALDL